jgi:hypothetical protein
MQKLLVCLTIAAFATITSLQAGEECPMAKSACCDQAKTACTAPKTAKTSATTSCCGAGKVAKVAKKNVDVKGAVVLVQR